MYTRFGENRLRKMETRTDLPACVPRVNPVFTYDHIGRLFAIQGKEGATVLETRFHMLNGEVRVLAGYAYDSIPKFQGREMKRIPRRLPNE